MKIASMISVSAMLLASAPVLAQEAPRPETRAYEVPSPNGARADEYYWLRDDTRKDPAMLAYLAAENAYADAQLARLQPLAAKLNDETLSHIKQDDSSVPYLDNGYWYSGRYEMGGNYPIIERSKEPGAPAQVILDVPAMAGDKPFFAVSSWAVSPDNRLLAWAEDAVGRRQYTLKVKNLETGEVFADAVDNIEANLVWAADNRTILYIAKDPVTLRGYRVMAHTLGTAPESDRLLYEEKDETFQMGISRTADDKYVCVAVESTVSDEQRCAPASDPSSLRVLAPREREFRYAADHMGDRWVIRTNRGAKNYKLVTLADADAARGEAAWRDLVPASDTAFIESFKPFNGFVAIDQRAGGNRSIRLLTDAGQSIPIVAEEPAYRMALDTNEEADTPWVRYTYGSLVTPTTTMEVNALTGERRTLKVTPVPGYDPANYVTERVWAPARDGTKIPVSLVYRKGTKLDGTAPLLQYAYGSYGYYCVEKVALATGLKS